MTAPDGRRHRPGLGGRPGPSPRVDLPDPAGRRPRPRHTGVPSVEQLAAFGRWVLALHQPAPVVPAQVRECSCGSALVLCPYRGAATRYLGPPTT